MTVHPYLPEDPDYTLVDSVRDSVRFAHYCLQPGAHGRWHAESSAVDSNGKPAEGNPLASLEGPGRFANALGGALSLFAWARFDQNHILEKVAVGLLDHVLEEGFIRPDGLVWDYRDAQTYEMYLNAERDNTWWNPPGQARIGLQMLRWIDALASDEVRAERLRTASAQIGVRLADVVGRLGYVPDRVRMDEGGEESGIAQSLNAAWLLMELSQRGTGSYMEVAREIIERAAQSEISGHRAGELALTARVMQRASALYRNPTYEEVAQTALSASRSLQLSVDLGAPTMGLLRDTAETFAISVADNAECAIACLESSKGTGDREVMCAGITILRGIARFHRTHAEPHGFLAAGLELSTDSREGGTTVRALDYTYPLYTCLRYVDAALQYLVQRVA
jgi:hypothetical protein